MSDTASATPCRELLPAPKSVSVLWAIGPADVAGELRAGHGAAASETSGRVTVLVHAPRRGRPDS
jgi:hypothetical protein